MIEHHHFRKVVKTDGSIFLTGLTPMKEVDIVVQERICLPNEMHNWLNDIRKSHPFAKMNKDEILKSLRKTRNTVWAERHAG